MNDAVREVEAATRRFYDAIETMVAGGGLDAMSEAWHHTDQVTTKHPMGGWALGWDEIWETWKVTATFGRADRAGGKVLDLRAHVYGDVAYVTVTFQAAPAWGGETILCTDVLLEKDGAWKIIHHHTDPSPAMQAALERMIEEG